MIMLLRGAPLTLAIFFASAASILAGELADQPFATILETKNLCKPPGKYLGWPSIAQAPNGDLIAVFSGDRLAHVSPDGKTQMVRSTDGGKTWDVRNEIKLAKGYSGDIGYPGSVQIEDGSIWTVFYQAERPGEKPCLMGAHWRLKDAPEKAK